MSFTFQKSEDVKPQSKQNNQGRSGEIEKNLARLLSLNQRKCKNKFLNISSFTQP